MYIASQVKLKDEMKNDSSMNFMLVVFCIALIGFVILNCRMNEKLSQKQAQVEQNAIAK